MEFVRGKMQHGHSVIADLDTGRIARGIHLALGVQSGTRRGCGDQLHDRLVADQRLTAPVLGNEREQPVLDAVPLCVLPRRMAVVGATPPGNSRSSRKHPGRIRRRRMV